MSTVKVAEIIKCHDSSASHDAVSSARRTLLAEASGLENLASSLGASFVDAVERMESIEGRVIVTGMGKSGHVGRKMAATLASTGTPSQFVHPAEASHGDLGMITRKDMIIAISNSGNTPELASVITYSRRYDIPIIAITSREDSILADACDILLLLPPTGEACPMGIAPTTTTTMTLALGDALAIALLERRGFTPLDFSVFHPGGSLGQKLVRVSDVMHGRDRMPLCTLDTPMGEAILTMTSKSFGVVGVLDDHGDLVGIITDGDLRRHMGYELLTYTARDVMTNTPVTIKRNALGAEAISVMNAKGLSCLFVAEGDQPVGIIHIHDLLAKGVV